jgi:hypothetical protein
MWRWNFSIAMDRMIQSLEGTTPLLRQEMLYHAILDIPVRMLPASFEP